MRIFENGHGRSYEISLELVGKGYEMLYTYDRTEVAGDILIHPRDVQWLNGAEFILGLRDVGINGGLFVTNRPTDKTNGTIHTEVLLYDHGSSAPLGDRQEYSPVTPNGELELIVGGVQRFVRLHLTRTPTKVQKKPQLDELAEVIELRPELITQTSEQIAA